MNTAEIPMILFTVIAQMCVGAYVALGAIQVYGRTRFKEAAVCRVVDPVLYVVMPIMVIGLIVSMFHMNDVFHVFNVFRHFESSWLTREIVFGLAFAAFGFLFAFMQWFRWATSVLRQIVAIIAALFGLALLYSMISIYATLKSTPAWSNWFTPFQFIVVAIVLGTLIVCVSLVVTNVVRANKTTSNKSGSKRGKGDSKPSGIVAFTKKRIASINAPASKDEWELTSHSVRSLTLVGMVGIVAWIGAYPVFISQMASGGVAEQQAAHVFTNPIFQVFLVLASLAAVLLAVVSFALVGRSNPTHVKKLAWVVTIAFVLALAAALVSRSIFYDLQIHVGF